MWAEKGNGGTSRKLTCFIFQIEKKKAIKCLWFGLCHVNRSAISARTIHGTDWILFKRKKEEGCLSLNTYSD